MYTSLDRILEILENERDDRGIQKRKRTGFNGRMTYGITVSKLRKTARKFGKSHELAIDLWDTEIFDARVVSCLLEEIKKVTKEQAEEQVSQIHFWLLSNVYCNAILTKCSFAEELIQNWIFHKEDIKRRCAYLLIYEFARSRKSKPSGYFSEKVKIIKEQIHLEENFVKDAMNNALWMIGQRNKELNRIALVAAKDIGPVVINYGDEEAVSVDCFAHLSNDQIQARFIDQ